MRTKAPAFQFYPGDWQRDAALRACSVGARGCWIEMICIMHQATPYGHLQLNGKAVELETLSRMIGATAKETKRWVDELEAAGVFDRTEAGAIYSRRMVKDERLRIARAEGGKLGGNPALKVNHKVGQKDNLDPNLQPTPSTRARAGVLLQSSSSIPPNPLLPSAGGEAVRGLDQVRIPKQLDSELGRSLIKDFATIQGKNSRFDPVSFQRIMSQLSDYQPRKALGFLAAWVQKGRYEPSYKVDWEEYAPPESAVNEPSQPAVLNRQPKIAGLKK